MVRKYIKDYEYLMQVIHPVCSLVAGRNINHGFSVLDMTNLNMAVINRQIWDIVKTAA